MILIIRYVLASENGPGSRIGHGVVAVDNNLVLFGGAVPGQPYNDVHVLNLGIDRILHDLCIFQTVNVPVFAC